jgi:hypothetical protein
MFVLNLVRDRLDDSDPILSLHRTAPPATAARRLSKSAIRPPKEPTPKIGWFASFERMMAAYADLAIRGLNE